MNARSVRDWFYDAVPFERKSATDWILPSLVGLGVGIALGVGAGLMLAPEPGEVTMKKLRRGADELRHRALGKVEKATGELESKTAEVRGKVERAASS